VIFLEPKILYRSAVEEVPDADYEIPLGKAEIMQTGEDVTVVGWGAQLRTLQAACDLAAKEGISCELIDIRTILPWDSECIINSVKKTGKLVVSHEAPITCGFGSEIVATLQQECVSSSNVKWLFAWQFACLIIQIFLNYIKHVLVLSFGSSNTADLWSGHSVWSRL